MILLAFPPEPVETTLSGGTDGAIPKQDSMGRAKAAVATSAAVASCQRGFSLPRTRQLPLARGWRHLTISKLGSLTQ